MPFGKSYIYLFIKICLTLYTVKPLYIDIRYNDKIRYDYLNGTIP